MSRSCLRASNPSANVTECLAHAPSRHASRHFRHSKRSAFYSRIATRMQSKSPRRMANLLSILCLLLFPRTKSLEGRSTSVWPRATCCVTRPYRRTTANKTSNWALSAPREGMRTKYMCLGVLMEVGFRYVGLCKYVTALHWHVASG